MNKLALLALSLAACGTDATATGTDPDTAPVAAVDRFSDAFGHLFKRSAPIFDPAHVQARVPAPNAPIDLDADFTIHALGPSGDAVTYYSLDILPRQPAKAYVVLHDGAEVPGQLPIIDGLPGDAGYNDFALVSEVNVGKDYVANTLTSFADVDAAVAAGDATVTDTQRIVNWAAVPAGTKADRKFIDQTVTGHRSWMRGQVVNQLRFEENLTVTAGGTVPVAQIVVIFENNADPSAGFAHEGSTQQTHNAIDTLAGGTKYSSLWNHSVGNKAHFDAVTDYTTAVANIMAKDVGVDVNCPEVR